MNVAVRLLLVGAGLALAGCSITDSVFPDPAPAHSDFADTVSQIKVIYPLLKLPGNPEISDSITAGSTWMSKSSQATIGLMSVP